MRILLPTDFSENAELATQFAIDLAKRTNGSILAFHAYDVPHYERSMTTSLLMEMKKSAESNMEEFEQNFLANAGVDYESRVVIGNPIRLSKELIRNSNLEIVVMGTKGASGIEEFLIGSNAASIIQNVDIPVLVIPPDSKLEGFHSIILASDLDFKGREEPLRQLAEIAKIFDASVSILHVQKESGIPKGTREMITEAFQGIDHSYSINSDNSDVEASILEHCEEKNADLVVAISKRYGFFEGLFHKSLTSKLAYHTKIPMLALHEPK